MKLSPIKNLEVPYFKDGEKKGIITLERGYEEEVTILRRSSDSVFLVLEEEPDRIECRVPTRFVHIY